MTAQEISIPFLDLVTLHTELEKEILEVVRKALSTAGFVGGHEVEQFETEFGRYCHTRYCVGVSSGTDALRFALIATGVRPGDVVVTVPNTFIATSEAISQAGALPEFVDIDERTYNLDPEKLREYLETQCYISDDSKLVTRRNHCPVSAIIPVHLYGQMADMDPILELAARYRLTVIEDACQAHGAEYFSRKHSRWFKAGSMGRAAAFSFYPGKNLGACGEAGAITTNDEELAHKVRMIRDHGQAKKYYHDIEGYNGRLDAIQAGVLRVKLAHLDTWNQQRRELAQTYHQLFKDTENIVVPYEPTHSKAVYHLFVVRVNDRESLKTYLGQRAIGTGIHYPVPLHLQNAYSALGYKVGDFPRCENVSAGILSLPMYAHLTHANQEYVVTTVKQYLHSRTWEALGSGTHPVSLA